MSCKYCNLVMKFEDNDTNKKDSLYISWSLKESD